jgi:hypothetical protein
MGLPYGTAQLDFLRTSMRGLEGVFGAVLGKPIR